MFDRRVSLTIEYLAGSASESVLHVITTKLFSLKRHWAVLDLVFTLGKIQQGCAMQTFAEDTVVQHA